MWIDTHAHLDKLSGVSAPRSGAEQALAEASQASVAAVISIGTSLQDWPEVLALSARFPGVFGALAAHPSEAAGFCPQWEDFLRKSLPSKKIIALGEMGLDYYKNPVDQKTQRDVFHRQLCLAAEAGLPALIHSRAAEEDTLAFLKEFQGENKGLLHCFTGSENLAKKALDRGFDISFSGISTFKNTGALREICSKLPLDRLHVETDAPYLAPEPRRGRENRPAWLVHTARKMAEIHKIAPEALSKRLSANFQRLFRRPPFGSG